MTFIPKKRSVLFFRSITFLVLCTFNISLIIAPSRSFAASASPVLGLPAPGTMINLTPSYVPVIAKGLRVHPENPVLFDFIIDTGNSGLKATDEELKTESKKLIKYFLATLTIPENDVWVNLSPYEKDCIITNELGQTEMGRDMLAQDYILKQLTASLIYPEKELGKEFWNKVYAKAQQLYGSTDIPVNTFNKVWIVADKAKVFVRNNTAFVVSCHMKVMLEEDYLSMNKHDQTGSTQSTNSIGSSIVREVVLPELEKEVNQGKNFANLRQIFNSMILASWYKKNLKEALLNQVYSNKAKINGVDLEDKTIKEQIYQEYLSAYKKGVFNYIKEDAVNGQRTPRKYFSGGLTPGKVLTPDVETALVAGDDTGTAGAVVNVSFATTRTTTTGTNHSKESVLELIQTLKKDAQGKGRYEAVDQLEGIYRRLAHNEVNPQDVLNELGAIQQSLALRLPSDQAMKVAIDDSTPAFPLTTGVKILKIEDRQIIFERKNINTLEFSRQGGSKRTISKVGATFDYPLSHGDEQVFKIEVKLMPSGFIIKNIGVKSITIADQAMTVNPVTNDVNIAQQVLNVASQEYALDDKSKEAFKDFLIKGTASVETAAQTIVFNGKTQKESAALLLVLRERTKNYEYFQTNSLWPLWKKIETIFLKYIKSANREGAKAEFQNIEGNDWEEFLTPIFNGIKARYDSIAPNLDKQIVATNGAKIKYLNGALLEVKQALKIEGSDELFMQNLVESIDLELFIKTLAEKFSVPKEQVRRILSSSQLLVNGHLDAAKLILDANSTLTIRFIPQLRLASTMADKKDVVIRPNIEKVIVASVDRVKFFNSLNSSNTVEYFKALPKDNLLSALGVRGIERLSPQQIIERFKLAYTDAVYFSVLIAKYLSDRIKPVLGKNGIASALLNTEARQKIFGITDAKDLMKNDEYLEEAKRVHMRVLQLKGGLGTSFQRLATLKRLLGRDKIADKGTDSYFENVPIKGFDVSGNQKRFNENISVAELKLLYYIYLAQKNEFNEIEVRELVNDESKEAVERFWDTVYLADRTDDRIPSDQKRTYRQIFSDPVKGIKGLRFNPDFIVQGVLPVVNAQNGEYLNDAPLRSPGGHAAFVSLTQDENAQNKKDLTVPRITVFTNGDGVNNMLPPAVAGWMVKKNIPIAMVTTTKQLLDLKGGLITLLSNKDLSKGIQEKLARFETLSVDEIAGLQNDLYPYLLEIAQAKAEGQQDIFQNMGITLGEKSAQFFNTNLHAQNHNILDPFLNELKSIIGDEKFYEIIGPDLIVNPKEKKLNGNPIKVIQLEGASGSALLAMNRFVLTTMDSKIVELKKKYGIERLVYFVNFDEEIRSEVFTPEKFTWDHYLYAFTDLFSVDPIRGRLVFSPIEGRSTLPGFDLDKFYEDLENDITAFGRSLKVKELDYLAIKGTVYFPNAILKGGVFINNKSGKAIDLSTQKDSFKFEGEHLVLDNLFINIDEQGMIATKPVTDLLEAIKEFEKSDVAMISGLQESTVLKARDAGLSLPNLLTEFTSSHRNGGGSFDDFVQAKIAEKASQLSLNTKGASPEEKDNALTSGPGGIDLNAKNLQMDVNGEKIDIKFDPAMIAQFRAGDFSGVKPVIINITPIPSIFPMLGLKEEDSLELAKV